MAQKTKTFYMRFYSTSYTTENMNEKTIHQFIKKYKPDDKSEYVTPLVSINDYSYRIKVCAEINNSISGYFITYRNELITKGNMTTGDEELLQFAKDEAIIEKTYFINFYNNHSEVIIYQNSRFGRANDLSSYILNVLKSDNLDGTIYLTSIGKDDFNLDNILHQKSSYIEYKLAKPRYRYIPDDNEAPWEQSQFILMDACNAGTFKAKLSTKSAAGLNKNKLREVIEILLNNSNTRKCKIKLEDIDEPIDLFADVLKAQFTLNTQPNGTIKELEVFNRIRTLKESYAIILDKYI
ncbi:hypothetical protein FHQ24_10005 [Pasteurellaceae bacterium UScroc31]|nr:hypothetical protein FHQ24_10005 [Pasteurellaceae bacterium UScroc31]